MTNFNSCFSFSWILLSAVICIAIQASFTLPQGVIHEIQRNNAEQIKNTAIDEEISHQVGQPPEMDDTNMENESRNCFPYFIYQDVESLLNQALKMLSVSKTEHQRNWLQLFVHRLESLLTQLRRLPVKYVNHCFRMRERFNPDILTNSDMSSAPEEVQLQLAKKLFLHSNHRVDKKHHLSDRLKEYVTGRISHERRNEDAEYEAVIPEESEITPKMPHQSNHAHIAHKSNKNNDVLPSNLELYNNEDVNLDATPDKSSSKYVNGNNPYDDVLLPITFWEKQNMHPETMPFLPRATRKVAHPVSEKMKFRALSAHSTHVDETTNNDEQDNSEIQTGLPSQSNDYTTNIDNKEHQEDITSTVISHPEDTNITPPTQHHKRSLSIDHDHDHSSSLSPSTDADDNASITDKSINTSKNEDDDDDLVIQLHSGGKLPKQQMDPRAFMRSGPIEVKTWPRGIPEGQLTSPESEEIPNSKEQDSSEESAIETKVPIDRIDAEIPIASDNRNALDFDYEEPGAAAGELFIDDDVIPTKYLTVPSSVNSVTSYDDHPDDIVRQLDELKSLKSEAFSPSNPMILTESTPVEPSDEDKDLPNQHLSADSK